MEIMSLEAMEEHFYGMDKPATLHSSNPNHRPYNGQMVTIKNKVEGDGLTAISVELADSRRLAVGKADLIPFDV